MTKDAGEIDAGGVANLGPLLASYRLVEICGPEVESSFFGDTIQLLKIVSRWHIRHPRPGLSNDDAYCYPAHPRK